MILVGEPHPELPLQSLIRSLGLGAHVRLLGYQPIEEFVGYLAACDIVLNLRYPTVGENSGTLMRALGLGQSGDRFRSRIVLRAAVQHLFEGAGRSKRRGSPLRVLESAGRAVPSFGVSWAHGRGPGWRPSAPGRRWRGGTPSSCDALPVARRFAGRMMRRRRRAPPAIEEPASDQTPGVQVEPEYISSWAPDQAALNYVEHPPDALRKDAGDHAARAVPAIAFSRWDRICRSRRRSKNGWDTARCEAATMVRLARSTTAA